MQEKIKILAVNNNQNFLPLLVRTLESELGAEVDHASSVEECMEKLDKNRYDGVILDYCLPGMTDLKILKDIRKKYEDVVLILLIDLLDEKAIGDCMKSGADDYVIRTSEYLTVLPVVINGALQKRGLLKRERMLLRELVKQDKLSSFGRLILGIAHNMNSPLAAIMGRVQLCIEREEKERRALLATKGKMPGEEFERQLKRHEKNLRDLNYINEAAARLSVIIKNMTDKGRQEQTEEIQSLNLNGLLREELNFLEADIFLKHEVTKHYEFTESLPHIRGVYSDFSQSLIAIIQNALDAMRSTEKKELTISTSCNGRSISVKIHHTGCSIKKEDKSKIFEPFFTPYSINTSHSPSPGIGLSLNGALMLLKPYGAQISLTSKPGDTTFIVEIPINQGKS